MLVRESNNTWNFRFFFQGQHTIKIWCKQTCKKETIETSIMKCCKILNVSLDRRNLFKSCKFFAVIFKLSLLKFHEPCWTPKVSNSIVLLTAMNKYNIHPGQSVRVGSRWNRYNSGEFPPILSEHAGNTPEGRSSIPNRNLAGNFPWLSN